MSSQGVTEPTREGASAPDQLAPGLVHIRQQASKVRRGTAFYKPGWDDSDPQRKTLCGAAAGADMSWAETRWAKYLAYVTCQRCRALRTAA